jgi:hypothetical protein
LVAFERTTNKKWVFTSNHPTKIWLVVWNILCFSHSVGNFIIPTSQLTFAYFSEGVSSQSHHFVVKPDGFSDGDPGGLRLAAGPLGVSIYSYNNLGVMIHGYSSYGNQPLMVITSMMVF